MFKELNNKFMRIFFITVIWILGILNIIFGSITVNLNIFWNIIGIAMLFATVFGVIYPYVWNYGTWIAPINIITTTIANLFCGFFSVYLLSKEMFALIIPYWLAITLLDLFMHILIFYFYRKFENKRLVKKLNRL
ncbi:hypothetical protein [Companilactobacillus insicii]|uniref:hypothetical protein n=1 Tax=Companilactobacillus insicii TaxID=1732567 RepID=UPI000F768664|nr:hypothetical protein [Companilactobacillus insicii]